MKTVDLPWNVLEPGMGVLMGDLVPWTIVQVDLENVTVERNGRTVGPRPLPEKDARVVLTARTAEILKEREANALAVLQELPGAEVVASGGKEL